MLTKPRQTLGQRRVDDTLLEPVVDIHVHVVHALQRFNALLLECLERGVLVRARRNGHGHVPLRRKPKVAERLGHEFHGQRASNASTFGHALLLPLRRDVLESMT
ncbi:hypothetical protein PsorP6_002274 [Peronosclerospora sorghi]|uniref:Uncharacterized protein n=1 Tax=Peronosclerospora sorghi TaxID=230839 RepID=A0ACC0WWD3_9STRA|nr:hypothetical protein PsorP6_002274 [Peronosclerospora sorghi]